MVQGRWDSANFSRIQARLAGPPGLAVFDFDNTLIYNDLGEAVMYYVARRGLLPAEDPTFRAVLADPRFCPPETAARLVETGNRYHAEYDAADRDAFAAELLKLYSWIHANFDLETTYRWTRIFFMGRPPGDLARLARDVFAYEQGRSVGQESLETIPGGPALAIPTGIRVVPEIAALTRRLRARGWEVRVVTASPRIVIAAVIEHWGLRPDQVTGMELATGADGRLLPEIVEPMPCQAGKVTALRAVPALAGRSIDLAVGDSRGDRDLLAAAGLGILLDRGDRELRAEAEGRGYIIQKQFDPVDPPTAG